MTTTLTPLNSDQPGNARRFEIEHFEHGWTGRRIEVIADLSTFEVDQTQFGAFRSMRGFVRNQGREFIGYFGVHGGAENMVFAGSPDDIIFARAFKFDGEWTLSDGPAVRESSGTGRLWAELENFWQATHPD